jgi:hypothetical protein
VFVVEIIANMKRDQSAMHRKHTRQWEKWSNQNKGHALTMEVGDHTRICGCFCTRPTLLGLLLATAHRAPVLEVHVDFRVCAAESGCSARGCPVDWLKLSLQLLKRLPRPTANPLTSHRKPNSCHRERHS